MVGGKGGGGGGAKGGASGRAKGDSAGASGKGSAAKHASGPSKGEGGPAKSAAGLANDAPKESSRPHRGGNWMNTEDAKRIQIRADLGIGDPGFKARAMAAAARNKREGRTP